MNESRSEFITARRLQYHIRHWGSDNSPILFMLHGWMDVSASFQFVVDCLKADWHVIAPDWRGFGLTDGGGVDSYWFPDYVADLDAILQHFSPTKPVTLVGHSMGGNVAGIYAGVRPERIQQFINLEGFGLSSTRPEQAPKRYARWLDDLRSPAALRTYPTLAAVAARLQKNNPRLSDERAAFLAAHWAAPNDAGEWAILGDPAHKIAGPLLYQVDEAMACWRAITAPVLWVEAANSDVWRWTKSEGDGRAEMDRRIQHIRNVTLATISDAGHMLHHDQPETLARLIEQFVLG